MPSVNLLPWRQKRRQRAKNCLVGCLLGAACLSISVLLSLYRYEKALVNARIAHNQQLRLASQQLGEPLRQVKQLKQNIEQLQVRRRTLLLMQANSIALVRCVEALVQALPEDVYLTRFQRQNDQLTINGFAASNVAISQLMVRMQDHCLVEKPLLTALKPNDAANFGFHNAFTIQFRQRHERTV